MENPTGQSAQDWMIFKGKLENTLPVKREKVLEFLERFPTPPWRSLSRFRAERLEQNRSEPPAQPQTSSDDQTSDKHKAPYYANDETVRLVNLALALRRPLLITGKPGVGKSSLAAAVSWELGLGQVLRWSITTQTTLKEGLYNYDAMGHVAAKNTGEADPEIGIGKFITLGPLGTALLPNSLPRVLLIDEIDKGEFDLPNNLLNVLEEGAFEILEIKRLSDKNKEVKVYQANSNELVTIPGKGWIEAYEFPLILMTSNGEREFPAAFRRRCLELEMKFPDEADFRRIFGQWLESAGVTTTRVPTLMSELDNIRARVDAKTDNFSIDQLLNLAFMLSRGVGTEDIERFLHTFLSQTKS